MPLTAGLRLPLACACAIATASAALLACANPGLGPERYRLAGSGAGWEDAGSDEVLADLRPRYPEFFRVVLTADRREDPDLRPLRDDLERKPVDRRNYDALNALAIGYYALNARAENSPGGDSYLQDSFRAAKLIAVPWRAYGLIEEPRLRSGILDFFDDIASGEKDMSMRTAARLARVVASMRRKEADPQRGQRIDEIVRRLTPPGARDER